MERRTRHTRAWLDGTAAGSAPHLLGESEVSARIHTARRGRAGLLGAERLSHARGPVERRTLWRAGDHATRDQSAAQLKQERRLTKDVAHRRRAETFHKDGVARRRCDTSS